MGAAVTRVCNRLRNTILMNELLRSAGAHAFARYGAQTVQRSTAVYSLRANVFVRDDAVCVAAAHSPGGAAHPDRGGLLLLRISADALPARSTSVEVRVAAGGGARKLPTTTAQWQEQWSVAANSAPLSSLATTAVCNFQSLPILLQRLVVTAGAAASKVRPGSGSDDRPSAAKRARR